MKIDNVNAYLYTSDISASYDAWGKQTVSSTKDDMDLMLCGYCGHTMLNEFDLIDMKGRLYDPVVGRFLSPDNYVRHQVFGAHANASSTVFLIHY